MFVPVLGKIGLKDEPEPPIGIVPGKLGRDGMPGIFGKPGILGFVGSPGNCGSPGKDGSGFVGSVGFVTTIGNKLSSGPPVVGVFCACTELTINKFTMMIDTNLFIFNFKRHLTVTPVRY